LLLADYRRDYIRPIGVNLDHVVLAHIVGRYEEMENQACEEMVAEGVSSDAIRFEREVDLNYSYQVDSLLLQRSRKGHWRTDQQLASRRIEKPILVRRAELERLLPLPVRTSQALKQGH
jgi:N-methylhydantoinase A/oxoprolinase/acetone carboxylase beta subunit